MLRRLLLFLCCGCSVLPLLAGCDNRGKAEREPVLPISPATQQQADDWQRLPPPDISRSPLQLRVVLAENRRFTGLAEEDLSAILDRTRQLVALFFGLEIEWLPANRVSVESLFAYLPQTLVEERQREIIPLAALDDNAREAIQQSIFSTLKNYAGHQQQVIDYALPYLLSDSRPRDFIELSYALADTLISRIRQWQALRAKDGGALLNDSPYEQWVWWDTLGYGALPYDVVITNQPVVSLEKYGMDVHSSLRGGFTAGTTTYNRQSAYGAYLYVSTYPFLHDNALLEELRGDRTYSRQQRIDYTAALLTHELGHLLLHLGHPFGQQACVMSPTPVLRYREWYDRLDAGACALNSGPAMTPGNAVIEYNRRWP